MAYIYATTTFERINGDEVKVDIVHNASGVAPGNTFDVDPVGYTLEFVPEDDRHMKPGIVSGKCTINTLWESGAALTTLLTNLTTADEGEWCIDLYRGAASDPFWSGTIVSDQFEILEGSAVQSCKIVAVDGLSMLKSVLYNDNGNPYQDYNTMQGYIRNIHEKWVLFDHLDTKYNASPTARFNIADDVVSTDQDNYTTHPSGTNMRVFQKTRLHNKTFYNVNEQFEKEYRNCYEILQSICNTFQMRLYAYSSAWHFVPVALQADDLTGYTERWNQVFIDDTQIVAAWNYQTTDTQKASGWVRSLTAPTTSVKLTRDLSDVIALSQFDSSYTMGSVVDGPQYFYPSRTNGDNEMYHVAGRIKIDISQITYSEDSDPLVPGRFAIKMGWLWHYTDGTNYEQVLRGLEKKTPPLSQSLWGPVFPGTNPEYDYTGFTYQLATFTETTSNTVVAGYYVHQDIPEEGHQFFYRTNVADTRFIDFHILLPAPLEDSDLFQMSLDVETYDYTGEVNATFAAAITPTIETLYVRQLKDGAQFELKDLDYHATTGTGQDRLDLGKTFIGDIGATGSVGGIEVYNGSSYAVSTNWVSQAQSTTKRINQLCVEELLAMHKESRNIERGLILSNDVTTYPRPFDRFYDSDTGFYYAALSYKEFGSMIEHDATLFKIGRNFSDVNFENEDPVVTRYEGGDGLAAGEQTTDVLKPTSVGVPFNAESATIFEDWNTATVGGGQTLELYYTVSTNGQGQYFVNQGQDPPTNYTIERTVFVNDEALATHSDSGWSTPSGLQPAADAPTGVRIEKVWDSINAYMQKLDNPCYSFAVFYNEQFDGKLFDTYDDYVGGWSLRKLRSGYTGNCITVRRTGSSPASSDIGFDSEGNLDTAALLSFVGSDDGFVTKWYDQGGSNDLIQAATANQPQIVSSGAVITLNGKPAMDFDGSNDTLYSSTNINPNPDGKFTGACVYATDSTSTGQNVVSSWNSSQSNQNFQHQCLSTGKARWGYRYTNGQFPRPDTTSALTTDQRITCAQFYRNFAKAWYNGAEESDKFSANISTVNPNQSSTSFRIGARSDNSAGMFNGKFQECVLFSQASTAHDADAMSDEINNFYGAY